MRKPQRLSGLSLRYRLLLITLASLFVGIAAIDVATVTALRSFLISRIDTQLESNVAPAARLVILRGGDVGNFGSAPLLALPSGTFGEFVFANGSSITGEFSSAQTPALLPPNVTSGPIGQQKVSIPINRAMTLRQGDIAYRVIAEPYSAYGGTMVLAIPLISVSDTIGRLELAELLVSAGVILGLGVLATASIRLGLSPLERMRTQAKEVTVGDAKAKVDSYGPAEVRTLAESLNTMLERLQLALLDSQTSQERLRQFIADVSHELRTPLTSIKGYADLYLRGALTDEDGVSVAMGRISSESTRMAALIEDLLLLARMDQNRPLTLSPVDLSGLVSQGIMDAQAVEPERRFEASIADGVLVLGDQHRLTQVLANLLANVRTHTPAGSKVGITLECLPKGTPPPVGSRNARGGSGDAFGGVDETIGMLDYSEITRLMVTDSGPGLNQNQLDRVFERFYRSDESRSRAKGGAGLGLALVAAIARSHGGVAWAFSPGENQGATFGIDLPRLVLEEEDPSQAAPDEETPSKLPAKRSQGGSRWRAGR